MGRNKFTGPRDFHLHTSGEHYPAYYGCMFTESTVILEIHNHAWLWLPPLIPISYFTSKLKICQNIVPSLVPSLRKQLFCKVNSSCNFHFKHDMTHILRISLMCLRWMSDRNIILLIFKVHDFIYFHFPEKDSVDIIHNMT